MSYEPFKTWHMSAEKTNFNGHRIIGRREKEEGVTPLFLRNRRRHSGAAAHLCEKLIIITTVMPAADAIVSLM